MDIDGLQRGLRISVRTVVTREWRLFGGVILWLFAYALWVGATAAALSQFASLLSVTIDPWTTETTVAGLLAVVLWILLPAVAATWLVVRELTNVSDNIADEYRIHPLLLLVPPLVGVAGTLGALVAVGSGSIPLLVAAVVAALFFHIRTLTYSYRVFSFSYPRIQQLSLVLTVSVVLFAVLVEGAVAAGQEVFVSDAVAGLGDALGVTGAGEFVDGTSAVAGVSVPTSYSVAIATPLALGGGYVGVQFLVGLLVRLRGKAIPRSELRTGQRYPEFARPTTAKQPSRSSSATANGGAPASADSSSDTAQTTGSNPSTAETSESPDTGDEPASSDTVSHTRVFTPSETDSQTVVDADEECPFCGADLPAGADSCHDCGASL